jgi:Domain of unknown function (DUF4214)
MLCSVSAWNLRQRGPSLIGLLVVSMALPAPTAASAALSTGTTLHCAPGASCSGVVAKIDSQGAFVVNAYRDLLGRPPSDSDASYWLGRLGEGAGREAMAREIASSAEYRDELVVSIYQRFLERSPSAGEVSYATGLLGAGGSDEQLIAALVGSSEYYGLSGETIAGFVSRAYSDLLGREATKEEKGSWEAFLSSGHTREQLAGEITASPEYREDLIRALYQRFLQREAGAGEVSYWTGVLGAGGSDEQLIAALVGSSEYYFHDPGWSATIEWGDGASSPAVVSGEELSGAHIYAQAGSYQIAVKLADSRGPVATIAGSAVVSAPLVVNHFTFSKQTLNPHTGTAILRIALPGPGSLSFGGRGVALRLLALPARLSALQTKSITAAGTVKLLVKAKGKTRRRLRRKGSARVRVALTFTPTGGTPNRKTHLVRLRKARR